MLQSTASNGVAKTSVFIPATLVSIGLFYEAHYQVSCFVKIEWLANTIPG